MDLGQVQQTGETTTDAVSCWKKGMETHGLRRTTAPTWEEPILLIDLKMKMRSCCRGMYCTRIVFLPRVLEMYTTCFLQPQTDDREPLKHYSENGFPWRHDEDDKSSPFSSSVPRLVTSSIGIDGIIFPLIV